MVFDNLVAQCDCYLAGNVAIYVNYILIKLCIFLYHFHKLVSLSEHCYLYRYIYIYFTVILKGLEEITSSIFHRT